MTIAAAGVARAGAKRAATRAGSAKSKPIVIKQDVRSAKAIETHRTNERGRLRNYETIEKVAEEQQVLAAKTREYRARRAETRVEASAAGGRQRAYNAVGSIASAPSNPTANPIMLILFTVFGLIIFYALVTKPQPTSTFFGSLGNWLALLSTSTPIFQKK